MFGYSLGQFHFRKPCVHHFKRKVLQLRFNLFQIHGGDCSIHEPNNETERHFTSQLQHMISIQLRDGYK